MKKPLFFLTTLVLLSMSFNTFAYQRGHNNGHSNYQVFNSPYRNGIQHSYSGYGYYDGGHNNYQQGHGYLGHNNYNQVRHGYGYQNSYGHDNNAYQYYQPYYDNFDYSHQGGWNHGGGGFGFSLYLH